MKLEDAFSGDGALIGFIVAGDPGFEESFEAAETLLENGVDVLELGLAFSDPLADGPTIQAAASRAIKAGMNTDEYFRLAEKISEKYSKPLVCLGYYNMMHAYGLEEFARKCGETGIKGVITPDLPLEEAGEFKTYLNENNVDMVFIAAETTSNERVKKLSSEGGGFLYLTAVLGVTGARDETSKKLGETIRRVKEHSSLPVAVGFGLSTPRQIRQVLEYGADAAIVGSAIVKENMRQDSESLGEFIKSLKKAVTG